MAKGWMGFIERYEEGDMEAMKKVEAHPTDKGKFQSSVDKYGHGKGKGKSRSAVYKHISQIGEKTHNKGKSDPKISKPEIKAETTILEEEEQEDFTKSEETEFETISWLEDEGDLPPPTIPIPIRKFVLGDGGMNELQRATQTQLIKWGWMATDRGLTHWGRGVMNEPEWEIMRHPEDYEALEAATTNLMDAYGIAFHLSPTTVFGVVVSAAYVPPIAHIARNTDPSRSGRIWGGIKSIVTAPFRLFRRRRRNDGISRTPIQTES